MQSTSGDPRTTKPHQFSGTPTPPETEHLPCPRCHSTNTKFCYYNNYNFSQPRHFCKSCRRYWTHGGSLRDIPVGGGSRKNAKRCRTTSSVHENSQLYPTTPVYFPATPDHYPFAGDGDVKGNIGMCGSFTSLLNIQGSGILPMGGFGFGVGNGLEELGFGLGRGVWAFNGVGDDGVLGNTWQVESGEGGFMGGECFTLPNLAISTPGYSMK